MNDAACLPRANNRPLAQRMRVAAPTRFDGFGGALRRAYDISGGDSALERDLKELLAKLGA